MNCCTLVIYLTNIILKSFGSFGIQTIPSWHLIQRSSIGRGKQFQLRLKLLEVHQQIDYVGRSSINYCLVYCMLVSSEICHAIRHFHAFQSWSLQMTSWPASGFVFLVSLFQCFWLPIWWWILTEVMLANNWHNLKRRLGNENKSNIYSSGALSSYDIQEQKQGLYFSSGS